MGAALAMPTGATSFDIDLQMDATKFNANAFKASVLSAANNPVNAKVEIESVTFNVDVQYSFAETVTSRTLLIIIMKGSVATTAAVAERQVKVVLKTTRRLNVNEVFGEVLSQLLEAFVPPDPHDSFPGRRSEDGRRLATTVTAQISTNNQTAVKSITTNVADPTIVQQAMQSSGTSSTVTVAQEPTTSVKLKARIISGRSTPVAMPNITLLQAMLSDALDTQVDVRVDNLEKTSSAFQSLTSPLLLWGIVLLSSCWTQH